MRKKIIISLSLLLQFGSWIGYSNNSKAPIVLEKTSQSEQINLNLKDISIKKIFILIEQQTNSKFIYMSDQQFLQKKISIAVNNKNLDQVLTVLKTKANLDFKVTKSGVLVKELIAEKPKYTEETRRINGLVLDESNFPIPGASVFVMGTKIATITDFDGKFTLNIPVNLTTLSVSYMGFETKEINIENKTEIKVQLSNTVSQLEEIVIVGYGKQKKTDATGALQIVDVSKLAQSPANSVLNDLQGKVAGVTVINTGGDPTATPLVRIRGRSTFNNESPLYVVDGVPNAPIPANLDIESMTILKDASAAAIYGMQASAGVILIDTKKGKANKTSLMLNVYSGVNETSKKIYGLNAKQYAGVMNTAFDNAGIAADSPQRDYINPDKNPYGFIDRTNWTDAIFRSAIVNNYDLSVSSGTDKSQLYSSLNYRKSEGVLLNTYQEKVSYRINTLLKFSPKIKLANNFSIQYTNGNYGVDVNNAYTGVPISAIYYPTSATIYENNNTDGIFGGTAPVGSPYIGSYGDLANPVANLLRLNNKKPTLNLSGNAKLDYEFLPNLTYGLNTSIVLEKQSIKNFRSKRTEPGKPLNSNFLYQAENQNLNWLIENTLKYKKSFGAHAVDLLAGYTAQYFQSSFFNMGSQGFHSENDEHQYFGLAQGPYDTPNSGKSENKLVSFLGRINYNYDKRYMMTATVRRDGTSKLITSKRWGNFYSVSGAWNMAQEHFMDDFDFVSEFKFRAGWGQIGNVNALGDFPYSAAYKRVFSLLGVAPNINNNIGYAQAQLSNKNLKWETTEQTNFGLDFSFLKNSIYGSLDMYNKITKDILMIPPVLGTAGVSIGPWQNAAKVQNKGYEFAIGYRNKIKDFKYDISGNISQVKNEVQKLTPGVDYIEENGMNVRGTLRPIRSEVGQPIYSYYVYQSTGLFQTQTQADNYLNAKGEKLQPNAKPGDLIFADRNGDGIINDKDRYFAGSAFPKISYGASLRVEYKGLDLSVVTQGVAGLKVFNGMKLSVLKPTQGYNMSTEILNAWTPENPNSNIPRVSLSDTNRNFGTTSDWYLEDASYIRFKDITLGYTFGNTLAKRMGINGFRVYATAYNLFTITKYSGFDPELIASSGIDQGSYPTPKTYIIGVNLNF